jgi:hypothetical protein
MTMRSRLLLALPAALLVALPAAAPATAARKDVRLRQFKTCPSLIKYGIKHAPAVERSAITEPPAPIRPAAPLPPGMQQDMAGAPAPAAAEGGARAGEDYSATNNQEAGVDEPDVVKTDGSTVFAVAGAAIQAVDVRSDPPKVVGTLALEGAFDAQLLIDGDRALVTWTKSLPAVFEAQFAPSPAPSPVYAQPKTVLAEVDISDPSAMKIVRTMTVDGTFVASRLTKSTARVVLSTTPRALAESGPAPVPAGSARAAARRISRKRAAAWLPAATFRNLRRHTSRRRALSHCRATRHPKVFSGLDMLTVLTIDLSKGLEPVDSDSVMSAGDTVYASDKALYVATQRWQPAVWAGRETDVTGTTSQIHKFDISDPDDTRYRGSGQVPGFLLGQFALSERAGVLRVASTLVPPWSPTAPQETESQVATLAERDNALVQLGRVGGLGKGERIYAVRFIDDTGYVVTFRQVDPLYTVDVSDPATPKVVGELKVLGYSAYLHPAGKDLLIGIGQDATEEGFRSGAQISLFDVSNPAAPTRLQQRVLGSGSSSVEYDHHAFLWWPQTNLAVLPVSLFTPSSNAERRSSGCCGESFVGAIGFGITRQAITEVGRVAHESATVTRSLVVRGRLYTLSALGLKASRLDTLAETGWAPFPTPG